MAQGDPIQHVVVLDVGEQLIRPDAWLYDRRLSAGRWTEASGSGYVHESGLPR